MEDYSYNENQQPLTIETPQHVDGLEKGFKSVDLSEARSHRWSKGLRIKTEMRKKSQRNPH